MTTLLTPWGENFNKNCPLPDYPRPQLERKNYTILNGTWEYKICSMTNRDSSIEVPPEKYDGTITVPFSPESALSQVGHILQKHEVLWYRRNIIISTENTEADFSRKQNSGEQNHRVLLHFGAVDQCCRVFINKKLKIYHEGGYTPFSIDITEDVHAGPGKNTTVSALVEVSVIDNADSSIYSRGKQTYKRGGIWYTPTSGIWQTVWAEIVPAVYISSLKIKPDYDNAKVIISFEMNRSNEQKSQQVQTSAIDMYPSSLQVFDGTETLENVHYTYDQLSERCIFTVQLPPDFKSWSPESPFLYNFTLTAGNDTVTSYFAMRKFSLIRNNKGQLVTALNNKPYFHNGVLDQGYWSDGLYTAPHDEALVYDIRMMKELGFNMIRKHIKVEPLRWYYHCDRLGMIVWQDIVSGGSSYSPWIIQILPFIGIHIKDSRYRLFGRQNEYSRAEYDHELETTITHLYSCPCIAVWVPFNEGWGQFDALTAERKVREIDSTRLIDHASGWHDQKGGDFKSRHVYYKPVKLSPDKKLNRALALTEFGGYSLPVENHRSSSKDFGYRIYKSRESFSSAFMRLYQNEVIKHIKKGLSAAVYTQLSDVEDEVNGLLTYDRKVLKIDIHKIKELNKNVRFEE